ncbi:murein biosynthesis integral membrane protein MurJ [Candidatus Uhrbacteria bacterium CG10_big_fil_rev_8_21_14_0_10_48_16]|uniref:Probable lipid II flippase MurJ n=1 Tax=Candidatus Uhrbacteria bacterium CG10_big_fil_rev_8_21_14_0_10_48_16 TaxID=1975038 RepID=A0A2M8LGG9_9BACT|nr:MAG: murein biosynthesis integral membrane protein MurJ [Candidatus Uhrbacteria bacterium CG10_big_fil_rev_8_21_14_0_10_48_16]
MLRFIQKESKTIIGAATIVGVLSFMSRIVGFIRDRILAGAFGAGDTLDVYYAAFKIPDLLFSLIVVGALSASFIPIFLSHYNHPLGKEKAWAFANNTVHLIGGIVVVSSILLILFSGPLSEVVAPGFQEFKQVRVASFMRVMFLGQVFLAISMIYGSVLQSLKKFFLYALAPIFYNVGIIIGAFWLVDFMGPVGLAWGVVLGAFIHLLVQIVGLKDTEYRYRFVFDLRSKDVVKMAKLMGPRTIGIAVNQLMFILLTVIASTFVAGSLTVFQFAYNIEFFPVGIIGVSFAIAVFPTLSELADKKNFEEFIRVIAGTTRQLLYLLVPMTLLFLIMRAQIVRVVVGAGAFDWVATIATADTLAFFALTFIPQSLVFLLARAFYALHDTITPLVVAVVSALIGVLSAFLLKDAFGVIALAMAYSVASTINALLLWITLRQRMGTLNESTILPVVFKIAISGMLSGFVMQLLKPVVVSFLSLESFMGVFLQGFLAGGAGLLVYVFMGWMLRIEEQSKFFAGFKRSTMRQSSPQEVIPDN